MSAAAAVLETKKAAKPQIPTAHPPYASMVTAAITSVKERTGSSRQSILKYVVANYEVDTTKAGSRVTKALKKMIAGKSVVSAAAAGKKGAGCLKLHTC